MQKRSKKAEYYALAAEARRLAEGAHNPAEKLDLFDVERGWLSLWERGANDEQMRAA